MEAITVFYPPTRRLSPCSSHFVFSPCTSLFLTHTVSPLLLQDAAGDKRTAVSSTFFRSKAPNLSALSVCTRSTILHSRKESRCVRLDLSFMAFKAIFLKGCSPESPSQLSELRQLFPATVFELAPSLHGF